MDISQFISTYVTEVTFIACALLGGIMHYIKKYLNGETEAKIHEWYGRDNLAATVYTITVFFFAIIGAIAADVVNSETSFWAAMYSGFVTGFAIDAGFNGDARQMTKDLIDTKGDLNDLLKKEDKEVSAKRYPGSNYDRNEEESMMPRPGSRIRYRPRPPEGRLVV